MGDVDAENMLFAPTSGNITLKKASIKADVFDQLHFPLTLRGGYIDEMTTTFTVSLFSTSNAAKVVINNVLLVVGPHTTDWSWNHVHQCKTRLVDLVMKVYELK